MAGYRVGDRPVTGYRLTGFLGRGSYGEVWKAAGPGGTEAALKFIRLDSKQGMKEFRAIGLVKKLRHPCLVPIHAIWLRDMDGNTMGDGDDEPDSVMINMGGTKELVIAMGLGDKSLAQVAEEATDRRVPPDELLEYMDNAAKGIDYLNRPIHPPGNAAIIHCDIKPGNLLVVGGGVQVCDYGVARAVSATARQTQAAGTPAYAPPELINGDPGPATDQYSLAITYYELRSGRLPFDERKATQSNLTGQLDLSGVEPKEQAVLRRATSMRPASRFASAGELVYELKVAVGLIAPSGVSRAGSTVRQALPPSQSRPAFDPLPPSRPVMAPLPPPPPAVALPTHPMGGTGTVSFGEPAPPSPPKRGSTGSFRTDVTTPSAKKPPAAPAKSRAGVAWAVGGLAALAAAGGIGYVVTRPPKPATTEKEGGKESASAPDALVRARKEFATGSVASAREGLALLSQVTGDPWRSQADALRSAWEPAAAAAADRVPGDWPAVKDYLDRLAKAEAVAVPAEDKEPLARFVKAARGAKLAASAPRLDARTDWAAIAAAAAASEPEPTALRVEAAIERGGKDVSPKLPAAAGYAGYVAAAQADDADAAVALEKDWLAPPAWLTDHRRARLFGLFVRSAEAARNPADPDLTKPYDPAKLGKARTTLAAAYHLAATPADAAKAAYLRALAAGPGDDGIRAAWATAFTPAVLDTLGLSGAQLARAKALAGRPLDPAELKALPPAFVYPFVYKRLEASAASPAAAAALAAAARDLQARPAEWAKVLPKAPAVAAGWFDTAAKWAGSPAGDGYAAWAAAARAAADGWEKASPPASAHPFARVVAAQAASARAKAKPDYGDRYAAYKAAHDAFRGAINDLPPAAKAELAAAYKWAADNAILAANFEPFDPTAAGDRAQLRTDFLRAAVEWGRKLIDLDPARLDGNDTVGCAIEDLAWLVRRPDRFDPTKEDSYPAAANKFVTAKGGDADDPTGGRAVARLHHGRCLFKWAEDHFYSRGPADPWRAELLDTAAADLAAAAGQVTGADAAECHYWLGQVADLRRLAKVGDPAAHAKTAAAEYRQAAADPDWRDLAAVGLGEAVDGVSGPVRGLIDARRPGAKFADVLKAVTDGDAGDRAQDRRQRAALRATLAAAYLNRRDYPNDADPQKALAAAREAVRLADHPSVPDDVRGDARHALGAALRDAAAGGTPAPADWAKACPEFEAAVTLADAAGRPDRLARRVELRFAYRRWMAAAADPADKATAAARIVALSGEIAGLFETSGYFASPDTVSAAAREAIKSVLPNLAAEVKTALAGGPTAAGKADRAAWGLAAAELAALKLPAGQAATADPAKAAADAEAALEDVSDPAVRASVRRQVERVRKLGGKG